MSSLKKVLGSVKEMVCLLATKLTTKVPCKCNSLSNPSKPAPSNVLGASSYGHSNDVDEMFDVQHNNIVINKNSIDNNILFILK